MTTGLAVVVWVSMLTVEAVTIAMASVWVLDIAQVVIFWPFGSGIVAVGDGDVAMTTGSGELVTTVLGVV
jgi:hypothetical protein